MPHVLDRLKQAQNKETPQADVADRMYQTLMSDIKLRAQEEARKEVMVEIEGARAETERVKAERDGAQIRLKASEELAGSLNVRIKSLEGAVSKGNKSIASGKQQLIDSNQVLKSELSQEKTKVQKLEVQIAGLEGKLSQKPKQVKTKTVQSQPMAIPDFTVSGVVRGQDGKIQSAKITPVTH